LFRIQNKDTEASFNVYLTCGFFGFSKELLVPRCDISVLLSLDVQGPWRLGLPVLIPLFQLLWLVGACRNDPNALEPGVQFFVLQRSRWAQWASVFHYVSFLAFTLYGVRLFPLFIVSYASKKCLCFIKSKLFFFLFCFVFEYYLKFFQFPNNKKPCFKDEWQCAKYMFVSTFLCTDDLKSLVAKQNLLNFFN